MKLVLNVGSLDHEEIESLLASLELLGFDSQRLQPNLNENTSISTIEDKEIESIRNWRVDVLQHVLLPFGIVFRLVFKV